MSSTQIIKVHNGEICFRGINISSWNDLLSCIDDKERYIDKLKEQIKMMVIAQPRDLFPGKDDLIMSVKISVDNIMDDYEYNSRMLQNLYVIKALIEDYVYKTPCTLEEAWKQAYVDIYADLKRGAEK